MNRRDFVLASGGFLLVAPSPRSRPDGRDIQSEATAGPAFGAMVSVNELDANEPIGRLFRSHCDVLTGAGPFYWEHIHPEPARFAWTDADKIVRFGSEGRASVRGHSLVWHDLTPPWLSLPVDRGVAQRILIEHVTEVVSHFRGRVSHWDVVNEPLLLDDRRPDGLRRTMWVDVLGPDYIATALRAARAADPDARLFINEFGVESDSARASAKRNKLRALLRQLKADGVPLDGVGIQSHLKGGQAFSQNGLGRFLDDTERLGLVVVASELDVDDSLFATDTNERDRQVANVYDRFLTIVAPHPVVECVVTWGLTDRNSWLQWFAPRNDGKRQRPLPFDDMLRPKPAWDVLNRHLPRIAQRARG